MGLASIGADGVIQRVALAFTLVAALSVVVSPSPGVAEVAGSSASTKDLMSASAGGQMGGSGELGSYPGDGEAESVGETELAPTVEAEALAVDGQAQTTAITMTDVASLVQTIDTSQFDPPSPDPAGITYLPSRDRLLMSDSEVNEMPIFADANLFDLTLTGGLLATSNTLAFSDEPTGLTINPANGHLFVSDDTSPRVYEVDPGADGLHGTGDDVVTSFAAAVFGSSDPEGIAYDVVGGDLYVVDGLANAVFRISSGPNGLFDGVAPEGDDFATSFDVAPLGAIDPEGIAFDEGRETLMIVDRANVVFETTNTGQLLRAIDISAASPSNPAGIVMAPGSVDPSQWTMYVAARGTDNNVDPNENDGKIYELASPPDPAANLPPSVDAGPHLSVAWPNPAVLDGTVTDDGKPAPSAVSTTWTMVSGPGVAAFTDASAIDTEVTFSAGGVYVLRLTASDGEYTSADHISVDVIGGPCPCTFEAQVEASSDDAEEVPSGEVTLTSTDLDMTTDTAGGGQTGLIIGLRFTGVSIPRGAQITSGYVQFQADEATSVATSLTIEGEAADNATTFASANGGISGRSRTSASAQWTPPAWPTVWAKGVDQQTSNIAAPIEEIVNRPGWSEGNALVLIITGTGERVAESFDGSFAPLLHVEYVVDDDSPVVSVVASDSGAAEPGSDTGEFTVSRTGPTDAALVVGYAVAGSATPGVDYVSLSGAVTIPVGQVSAPVTVTPLDDGDAESVETVDVTLVTDAAYVVAAPPGDAASVSIVDDEMFVDQFAESEATVVGSVVEGDLTRTLSSDDVHEVLEENRTGGAPSRRVSSLDHRWTFNVNAGETVTLIVEARHSANGEGDHFVFEYSTDGGAQFKEFPSALVVTDTAIDGIYERDFPSGTSGSVVIRVTDADQTAGNGVRDTLHVDELLIRTSGAFPVIPSVSVTATDALAAEQDLDSGVFTLSRTGSTVAALTVNYTVAGSATAAADFVPLPGAVTIPAGLAAATITVTPIDDGLAESVESVLLTLTASTSYAIGSSSSDTVSILDNDGSVVDDLANSEQTPFGSITAGDYTATHLSDDDYESITEDVYANGNRSRLEHQWTFNVTGGDPLNFYVEAHHSGGTDDFVFSYSLDGTTWIEMLTVTKTSDDNQAQQFALPTTINGQLLVRVVDSVRSRGDGDANTMMVDYLFIRSNGP